MIFTKPLNIFRIVSADAHPDPDGGEGCLRLPAGDLGLGAPRPQGGVRRSLLRGRILRRRQQRGGDRQRGTGPHRRRQEVGCTFY